MEYVNYAFNTMYRQWFIPPDYIPTKPTMISNSTNVDCLTSGKGVTGKGVTGKSVTGKSVTGKGVTGKGVTGKSVTGKSVTGKSYESIKSNEVWHMYNPVHCVRVFVVYREALRSVEEHFRNRRHEDLFRGEYDRATEANDRLRKNRLHAYICALYNYTHIGDYKRFDTEYHSDMYLSVREDTLLELDVDLDLICNTILIALAVRTPSIVGWVEEEDNNWIPVSSAQVLDANENKVVTIQLRNSKVGGRGVEKQRQTMISAMTIEDVEYQVYIYQVIV